MDINMERKDVALIGLGAYRRSEEADAIRVAAMKEVQVVARAKGAYRLPCPRFKILWSAHNLTNCSVKRHQRDLPDQNSFLP